jgi:hypothetical protein
MSTTVTAAPRSERGALTRNKIGWADLTWLVWRQYRVTIIVTAALVAALCAGLLWVNSQMPHAPCPENSECWETVYYYDRFAPPLLWAAFGLPIYIAAFWGAPVLAREYEQQTNLLAWSQDVSAPRWLVSRAVLLGLIAMAMSVVTVPAVTSLLGAMQTNGASDAFNDPWDAIPFEATVPLSAAYAIAGLGIGIAAGALLRRVVPAIGVTLAVYVGVRVLLQHFRFRLLPPLHRSTPVEILFAGRPNGSEMSQLETAYTLGGAWVGAAGQPTDAPRACYETADAAFVKCLRDAGITRWQTTYQSVDRVDQLRLIEAGVLIAVAVVAIATAVYLVGRRRTLA